METPLTATTTPLRRRNSIDLSVIPTKLITPSSAFDFELVSFKSADSYTSLKNLLPPTNSAVNSPTGAPAASSTITIRNRLVKQAAWAYLQPMSTSPNSSGRHFFRRMWNRVAGESFTNPINGFLGFIHRNVIPTITRALDLLLQAIRVGSHR